MELGRLVYVAKTFDAFITSRNCPVDHGLHDCVISTFRFSHSSDFIALLLYLNHKNEKKKQAIDKLD